MGVRPLRGSRRPTWVPLVLIAIAGISTLLTTVVVLIGMAVRPVLTHGWTTAGAMKAAEEAARTTVDCRVRVRVRVRVRAVGSDGASSAPAPDDELRRLPGLENGARAGHRARDVMAAMGFTVALCVFQSSQWEARCRRSRLRATGSTAAG
jgi:hypothetical protein